MKGEEDREFRIYEDGNMMKIDGPSQYKWVSIGDTFMMEHNFACSICTVFCNQGKIGTFSIKSKCILPIISIYGSTNKVKFEVSRYEIIKQ